MEARRKKSRLRPRRIIERPRLTRILDGSTAQVRMLIAPAGYGKTTLAEQWTSAEGRRVAWYPCRSSSADVAVLSVGLAQAAVELLPECDRRIRERVRGTQNPPAAVDLLAELLAEDFAAWPAAAWLVIDDYQFVCDVPEAERFVELLVERSPVNLLIASRRRPSWVTSRQLLYGTLFEVDQTQLAMNRDEADQLLQDQPPPLAAGLIALASGSPAVIGMAGVTATEMFPAGTAPEELYESFAEETYRELSPEVQVDLGLLVAASALDRQLADVLLGAERAGQTLATALSVGILEERDTRLDFHPLARAFLETRTHPGAVAMRDKAIGLCLTTYRERRDWDSAFDLVVRFGRKSDLDLVIQDALDPLLESGRLATVETWVQYASDKGETSPQVRLAAAELSMRRGQLSMAETLIHGVLRHAGVKGELQFRALKVAGQVAHLASRETDGLEFFSRAERAAHDEQSKRDARWGQLLTMTALERDDARELLEQLAQDTRVDDPRERVRLMGKRVNHAMRFGELPPIEEARQTEQLLSLVSDPSTRCSFRTVYSSALALGAHYSDALRVSDDLVQDASAHQVGFGLTYGHAVNAAALAGCRQFDEAHRTLDRAWAAARRCTDAVGEQNVYATRVRLLLQEERVTEACALEPPDVSKSLPGIRGEVMASRGLALASVGQVDDAMLLAEEAGRVTQSLEGTVLTAAIRAVVEVRTGSESAFEAVENLLDTAIRVGGLDLLVTCYRGNPSVLRLLLASSRTSERAIFAIGRAGDLDLAAMLGVRSELIFNPFAKLTKREHEVCALLCEGLTDKEIGRLLFITPETAKRHALRILQKTGFRSRRALALSAVQKQLDQAAPTATFEEPGSSGLS